MKHIEKILLEWNYSFTLQSSLIKLTLIQTDILKTYTDAVLTYANFPSEYGGFRLDEAPHDTSSQISSSGVRIPLELRMVPIANLSWAFLRERFWFLTCVLHIDLSSTFLNCQEYCSRYRDKQASNNQLLSPPKNKNTMMPNRTLAERTKHNKHTIRTSRTSAKVVEYKSGFPKEVIFPGPSC